MDIVDRLGVDAGKWFIYTLFGTHVVDKWLRELDFRLDKDDRPTSSYRGHDWYGLDVFHVEVFDHALTELSRAIGAQLRAEKP